ncbi:primary-amine oxidase [Eremomyces bilateralis CBS 781.70]|uniref:Amine oxidase n=1 Tax=Eremomyces bilateralis CBS 781.70 TaxID=1392243 RepID=A0A6G1G6S2_9PEZI|nr:primary-amine oxidase [Eremomyces bilateralis CBS 781.70]KAF1813785.1 primary-amine oxidase [Eremomyces bilateralis CBS 781.70]
MRPSFVTLSIAAAVAALPGTPLGYERALLKRALEQRTDGNSSTASCLGDVAETATAPYTNVWAQISAEDNRAVWDFVHDPALGLNLTDPEEATQTDNYVYFIDTVPVNKTDVLAYKAGGPPPPKYARVILFQGGKADPDSQEYMVGPLPVSTTTTIQPLDYLYNGGQGGRVPFNARVFDGPRSAATEPLIAETMSSIADITAALFQGSVYYGSEDERTNLSATSGTPQSFDGTQSFRSILFRLPGVASYLTPIDFYLLIDCTGTDSSLYFLKGFVTKERFFETEVELRAAFDAGELVQDYQQTLDADWALVNHKDDMGQRDLEDRFAPSSIELGGKRYKVDPEAQYIEYMGFTFYLSFSRTTGISIHDVKYKGDTVLFELSLQEALAQYGGNQPKAANTVYHDTYYSLGTDMGTLLEGYDCPFGSTFWNVSYHEANTTVTNTDSICIFEHDMNFPLARHRTGGGSSDYGFANLGVVKGAALTVRAIATIGNYDYMFDYSFHLDGSIEVAVRASGYLQSSPYYANQTSWGPRIHDATMGSLHDHIINYKADFDIVGVNNSLQVSELVVANVTQPWFPELGTFEQMKMNVSYKAEEEQFDWAPNNQAMYVVLNKNETNKWDQPRGYRIVPGRSDIHLSIANSPWSRDNAAFVKSHLAVTQQHDNEPFSNSIQNVNLPWAPQQDFAEFFDGESVDDTDLVVWFNLGMHHFTRAEDVPVTLYSEAYASIVFAPQNFNDQAQDGDLLNRRWIVPNKTATGEYVLEFENYGVPLPTCAVQFSEPVLGIEVDVTT